jgi:hypothetical protein
MPHEFHATDCRFEWWVPLDIEPAPKAAEHLHRVHPPSSLTANWRFFECPTITLPYFYRLDSILREEVKAAIRKRSHVKGNVKRPFLVWKGIRIGFEIVVAQFPSGGVILQFITERVCTTFSTLDLINLTALPSHRHNNQLRYAVEKLSSYLTTGSLQSRQTEVPEYRYYPVLHIFDYQPRDPAATIVDDIPWHEITSVGTRHRGINEGNTQLIPPYRAKNYSIRDDVCVIDKQSILIVSPSDYLEFGTIRFSACIALQMRGFLQSGHARGEWPATSPLEALLEKIRFSYRNPSVISDSVTFQRIWPTVLTELQVLQWVTSLESQLGVKWVVPSSLTVIIEKLEQLKQETGHVAHSLRTVIDLLKTDVNSAWNYIRRILESLVQSIFDRTHSSSRGQARVSESNLNELINKLNCEGTIPADITACMHLIRSYGNIGSHPGSRVYIPSDIAMTFVLNSLTQVFEWYVSTFLPSLEVECPNTHCKSRQSKERKYCTVCGTQLPVLGPRSCSRCKKEVDQSMKYCWNCGHALSAGPSDAESS